jgi:phosphoglycolate phosphatase-like HAD superfamily hydrolase
MPALPLLTVDLDGVVIAPLFGLHGGTHRGFLDPEAPPRRARVLPRWLGEPLDRLRFAPRRPLPAVGEALAELAARRSLIALTGRRSSPAGWLRRHGLAQHFDRVVFNRSPLSSPHFKLEQVEELRSPAHVDDDPRTAQLIADRTGITVYLRDWPQNRGLSLAPNVVRVSDLGELAARLAEDPPAEPS